MYSRCSHCQTQQAVSAEQLRRSRGLLTCSSCGKRFDALVSLSEQLGAEFAESPAPDFLADMSGNTSKSGAWGIASALMGLVFVAQLVYFEGSAIMRKPWVRSDLEEICGQLHCRLPEYKNLDEWAVSHSDFKILPNKNYVFSAAITNQAEFPQACPDLRLVLLNFSGQAIAERVFSGWQYASVAALGGNETAEIKLSIAALPEGMEAGGFTFALL